MAAALPEGEGRAEACRAEPREEVDEEECDQEEGDQEEGDQEAEPREAGDEEEGRMSAYMILDIEVHDPEQYDAYKAGAAASVEQYGGRYLVRGGQVTPMEGGWEPSRVVVLEFPSAERLHEWAASPEYRAVAPLREQATHTRSIVVEGV
jgi:uncharacterized protein (DUF1330 family)